MAMGFNVEKIVLGIVREHWTVLPTIPVFRENEDGSHDLLNILIGQEAVDIHDKLVGTLPNGKTINELVREIRERIDREEKENEQPT